MSGAKSKDRQRDIRLIWEREPNGAILQRDAAPYGLRTPNGFVWGHKLNHIFWMPRIPGTAALTVWSRSMLMAFGEGYDEKDWDEPLVEPRIVRPWPVLRLLAGDASGRPASRTTLNPVDRGCEHEHPWPRPLPPGHPPLHVVPVVVGAVVLPWTRNLRTVRPKCTSTMYPLWS